MKNLKQMSGKELASKLNSLDFENDYELYTAIEAEMDFRYEEDYKWKLINDN